MFAVALLVAVLFGAVVADGPSLPGRGKNDDDSNGHGNMLENSIIGGTPVLVRGDSDGSQYPFFVQLIRNDKGASPYCGGNSYEKERAQA